jgi:hypothetical protein
MAKLDEETIKNNKRYTLLKEAKSITIELLKDDYCLDEKSLKELKAHMVLWKTNIERIEEDLLHKDGF